jgi:hypothetical protein
MSRGDWWGFWFMTASVLVAVAVTIYAWWFA